MKKLKRITSKNQKTSIEIYESREGIYVLQKYVKKYDLEEDVFYEVRMKPDPSGSYGDVDLAEQEAKLLLGLE
jgi:hypothetical protein